MASLLRNSRLIMMGFASLRRTATTVTANAGAQVKTGGNLAVRRKSPVDPIKPRPAGAPPLIPLVGTSLNTGGQIGLGVVLLISAYFTYINYITNPEFYKSLGISREASKRDSEAHHGGAAGKKGGDGAHGKH